MKIFMHRKIMTYAIFVIAVIFIITACVNTDTDTDDLNDIFGDVDNSIFDEYIQGKQCFISRVAGSCQRSVDT